MQNAEPILVHRLTVICDPALVATIDELRRVAADGLPSRSEIVRLALEEKAARDLNGHGRSKKGPR